MKFITKYPKYLRGYDCKRQTKTRPENFLFSNFMHHMKPMGEKNHQKKFRPISPINSRDMAILIFGPAGRPSSVKIEKLSQKHQKWTKFDEISYTLSLYGKKTNL